MPQFDKVLSTAAEEGRGEGWTPGNTIYWRPGGQAHNVYNEDRAGDDGDDCVDAWWRISPVCLDGS